MWRWLCWLGIRSKVEAVDEEVEQRLNMIFSEDQAERSHLNVPRGEIIKCQVLNSEVAFCSDPRLPRTDLHSVLLKFSVFSTFGICWFLVSNFGASLILTIVFNKKGTLQQHNL